VKQFSLQLSSSLSIIFIHLSILIGINSAYCWTESIRIVDNRIPLAELRAVAIGETLYAAFIRDPYQDCFCYSRDNGQTWSQPFILNDTTRHHPVQNPEIKYSKGQLHYVWSEITFYPQIWHSRSSDGGRTWSQPNKVFNNSRSRAAYYPKLATNGDSLFLTCVVYDTSNIYKQCLFFRSFDAGETWQDSSSIEQGRIEVPQHPYLLYSQGALHFIHPMMVDVDSFGVEIYYKRSTDCGLTWLDRIILSPAETYPNAVASQGPSADADTAGHVLAAWMDYVNGSMCGVSGDIFYRVSLDNGETWQPYGSITNTQSGYDIYSLILGNSYHAVWSDYWLLGCYYAKEAHSVSIDSGASWATQEFISGPVDGNESVPNLVATISRTDTILHCLFIRSSYDSTIAGIYYMRDHDFVGVDDSHASNMPQAIWLKACPNPFNSTISFDYTIPENDATLEIFNIQGQLVRNIRLGAQKGRVVWDSKNSKGNEVSSGVYYATVKQAGIKKTIQIMLAR
jgi:hypothetical protein